jgi:hypothetical protein
MTAPDRFVRFLRLLKTRTMQLLCQSRDGLKFCLLLIAKGLLSGRCVSSPHIAGECDTFASAAKVLPYCLQKSSGATIMSMS